MTLCTQSLAWLVYAHTCPPGYQGYHSLKWQKEQLLSSPLMVLFIVQVLKTRNIPIGCHLDLLWSGFERGICQGSPLKMLTFHRLRLAGGILPV